MKLRATTLIEVIFYMLLIAAMLPAITGLLSSVFTARDKQEVTIEVEDDANRILALIESDLKKASSVSVPVASGTGTSLTMTINSGTSYTRTYTMTGTAITVATNGASPVVLTSNRVIYSNFSVSHVSSSAAYHVITISFTGTSLNTVNRRDRYFQKNYRSSVVLRPNL